MTTISTTPHIVMTPVERQQGRFMRAPDHPGESGAAAGGDNTGGEGAQNSVSGDSANNSGAGFDLTAFWNTEGGDGNEPPAKSGSAGKDSTPPSNEPAAPSLAQQLGDEFNKLDFGSLFSDQIVADIAENKFESVNKLFGDSMKQAVQASMQMNARVLRAYGEQLMNDVKAEIAATFNTRDDNDTLVRDFPSAADPKIRPAIEKVYSQALKNTKNDRAAAVAQTKEMLKLMSQITSADLGVEIAPRGPADSRAPSPTDWMKELAGR